MTLVGDYSVLYFYSLYTTYDDHYSASVLEYHLKVNASSPFTLTAAVMFLYRIFLKMQMGYRKRFGMKLVTPYEWGTALVVPVCPAPMMLHVSSWNPVDITPGPVD
ncbi:hypothetical protein GDO81_026059 [Engystomops pustulosus]|uniref:Uncharacterized protein n=1 Tax=Engystomops pustulosus TaxID=76066 RepID=A0AAV6YHX4_ENGPU|nr:hypothetical protein GDO81_026059 [Engystomops pustulosus]